MKNKTINWSEIISYIFFGVLTTVVNFIVFFLCKNVGLDYKISNVISWFFAVLFAYITNKYFVFKKTNQTKAENLKEAISFYSVRILSLGIDMLSMIALIELVKLSDFWAKVATQFIIVVANYVFSKLFVFKKGATGN